MIILVVEDVAETRDGIEALLQADGYQVIAVGGEPGAVASARQERPDLILVSLAGHLREVSVVARNIRRRAELGESVPIVIFCIGDVAEGDEVAIGQNTHITRPDNFNQLRALIARLLAVIPQAA
jgi:CheY-like chemotaxis protein